MTHKGLRVVKPQHNQCIYAVPNLYISKNDFTKLNAKIIASIYLFEFIY